MGDCWICGAPADSAEHRIKKADIVRAYGKGPYKGDSAPVHFRDGIQTAIQGPRSERIKYQKSLCHACNTTRTKPLDEAYDRLMSWLVANEKIVLEALH
jgi:5-methylcytosine-specific restriction endonuclease McrA